MREGVDLISHYIREMRLGLLVGGSESNSDLIPAPGGIRVQT